MQLQAAYFLSCPYFQSASMKKPCVLSRFSIHQTSAVRHDQSVQKKKVFFKKKEMMIFDEGKAF